MGAPDLSVVDVDMNGTVVELDDLAGVEAAVCGSNSKKAEQVGLDLFFAIDNSYSMVFNLKWDEVSAALESFISDPKFNGLGVGIQYFPQRLQCTASEYATPAVPVGVLPGVANALITSISGRRMSGGTPLIPALSGIYQYAATINPAGSSRRTIVILATDGAPDDTCQPVDDAGMALDPVTAASSLIQAAAQATPAVNTYVIGVGSNLSALDTLAVGRRRLAHRVPGRHYAGHRDRVPRRARPPFGNQALVCNFQIPDPAPGLHIDYNKENVSFSDPTSSSQYVYVGSQADCTKSPTQGWYYDNPLAPTQVVL